MSLKLKIRVKNLGTIKEAEIDFNSLTIFGGVNNTGKSYVSRFLYSFLDALDRDIEHSYLRHRAKKFRSHNPNTRMLPYFVERYTESNKNTPSDTEETTEEIIRSMMRAIRNFYFEKFQDTDEIDEILRDKIKPGYEILKGISDSMKENDNKKSSDSLQEGYISLSTFNDRKWSEPNGLPAIIEFIEEMLNYKDVYGNEELIIQTYREALEDNLIHNFQIHQLQDLIYDGGTKSNLEFAVSLPGDTEAEIVCVINSQGKLSLNPKSTSLLTEGWTTQFSKVVYLESPTYWKLDDVLSEVPVNRPSRLFRRNRSSVQLRGVPQYFYDLRDETLETPDSNNAIDKEILAEEANALPGKIARAETPRKELIYTSNEGKGYKLHHTATGIVQLAFLMYLVDSHVIGKGTIVFYDEAEAHLHPKWQTVMIRALHKLAKNEVHIVLATHSADIIQWLSIEMKKDEKINDILAINHFLDKGVAKSHEKNKYKCRKILEELTDPFAEEYFRGLSSS